MTRFRTVAPGALLIALMACGGEAPQGEENADAAQTEAPATADPAAVTDTYAPELGVDLNAMQRSETGLHWQDLSEGTGDPAETGDVVRVHYTGRLPDGSTFDTSIPRGEPFAVTLGSGRVIPGWEEGLLGMKQGGRRLLVIPPGLGYGAAGAGNGVIPPNATLVFEVEVIEIVAGTG